MQILLLAILLLAAKPVLAFCPICAVAAGAGLEIARVLGVDDSIVGLWVGGLSVALIGWTIDWLGKKKWTFPYVGLATSIFYYAITLVPMYYMKMLGDSVLPFYGWPLSKFVIAIVPGSLVFWAAEEWYLEVKRRNNNKAHFPFEKIVFPLGSLLIISLIYFAITR
ncbi:MAG: hypothetical protein WCO55_00850 [Candidatus Falkowbacteria bacterium]